MMLFKTDARYDERELAKKCGLRWDSVTKCWYTNSDTVFDKWLSAARPQIAANKPEPVAKMWS
jgi:hypothetical protein